MHKIIFLLLFQSILFFPNYLYSAENLKLNKNLNYNSDSNDGPLISADNLSSGKITSGKPAHIIFYHRECYNSKRQAKRTVELYAKYKDKVDFIVVDLDTQISKEQRELKNKFYKRYIPHITIINKESKVVYDRSGEIASTRLSKILEESLK